MDIVEWNEDPSIYIGNALNPAQVVNVDFHQADGSCTVIVPDYQLSLAIGKKGQNARLAAKLTGYKIDIKSETEYNKLLMESGAQKLHPMKTMLTRFILSLAWTKFSLLRKLLMISQSQRKIRITRKNTKMMKKSLILKMSSN